MVYNIPIWAVLSFVGLILIAFIVGYFFIRRHLKNEKEKEHQLREINGIGK